MGISVHDLAVLFCLFNASESSPLNDESLAGGSALSGLRKRELNSNSNSSGDNGAIHEKEKGPFDFYVLSMSYQPEFCYQHRRESFPGCEAPNEFWKGSLTMHGLWPEVSYYSMIEKRCILLCHSTLVLCIEYVHLFHIERRRFLAIHLFEREI